MSQPMGQDGTPCTLDYTTNQEVHEGDVIRSVRTGRCWLVEEARRSPSIPGKWNLKCVRLGIDETIKDGDPGVHRLFWQSRNPRR